MFFEESINTFSRKYAYFSIKLHILFETESQSVDFMANNNPLVSVLKIRKKYNNYDQGQFSPFCVTLPYVLLLYLRLKTSLQQPDLHIHYKYPSHWILIQRYY